MINLSLRLKMILMLAVFFVTALAASGLGAYRMKMLGDALEHQTREITPRMLEASNIEKLFDQLANDQRTVILEDTQEGMDKGRDAMIATYQKLGEASARFAGLSTDAQKEKLGALAGCYSAWWSETGQVLELAYAGKKQEAFAWAKAKQRASRLEAKKIIAEIISEDSVEMNAHTEKLEQTYRNSVRLMVIGSLILLGAGALFAAYIIRSVTRAINGVIHELSQTARQVTSTAGKLAESSEELSQSTDQQAASIEQTASAVEEMNAMIGRNTSSAESAADAASSSQASARQGKQVVEEVIGAIQELSDSHQAILSQVQESNKEMDEISKVIAGISAKTRVINDIVFQTKILSFNASVEAARAGEMGKGFAVVAEEVGKLAQMSGGAAKEIAEILDASLRQVDQIAKSTQTRVERLIEDGKEKVDSTTAVARQCATVLDDIVEKASSVSQMSQAITVASQEQASGAQAITRAMHQLNTVTQNNALASKHTATAADELSGESKSLQRAIFHLVSTVQGGRAGLGHELVTGENSEVVRDDKGDEAAAA